MCLGILVSCVVMPREELVRKTIPTMLPAVVCYKSCTLHCTERRIKYTLSHQTSACLLSVPFKNAVFMQTICDCQGYVVDV
jgi:hypothetical protein